MLAETRATVDAINRRLGYRLQLREISWPARVAIGKPFTVEATWANAGVAPCYPGGFVALTLKDDKGGMVAVLVDEGFDVRDLSPARRTRPQPFRAATNSPPETSRRSRGRARTTSSSRSAAATARRCSNCRSPTATDNGGTASARSS